MLHQGEINDTEIAGKYSLGTMYEITKEELINGASVDDAISTAKLQYLKTDEMMYWFNNLAGKGFDEWAEQTQQQLAAQTPASIITQNNSVSSVENNTRNMAYSVPSDVPREQITPRINVYINDERQDAVVTNGGY